MWHGVIIANAKNSVHVFLIAFENENSMRKVAFQWMTVAAMLLGVSNAVHAHDSKIVKGLKTPESAIEGADGKIYVSEIGEFGKDGDGQVSVVDAQGNLKVFATGMDDPKGLAIVGKYLYVADKARVLKVAPDGTWEVFVHAEGFPIKPQFLNDMESDSKGTLYVSDSGDLMNGKGGGAIYAIDQKGKVTTITDAKKDQRVRSPNGLLMTDREAALLEVDFETGVMYKLNLKTHALDGVAEGFGGGDGIARHNAETVFVSDWKTGKVYTFSQGRVKLIKEGFQSAADIAITKDHKYLLIPDMKAGELYYMPLH